LPLVSYPMTPLPTRVAFAISSSDKTLFTGKALVNALYFCSTFNGIITISDVDDNVICKVTPGRFNSGYSLTWVLRVPFIVENGLKYSSSTTFNFFYVTYTPEG